MRAAILTLAVAEAGLQPSQRVVLDELGTLQLEWAQVRGREGAVA